MESIQESAEDIENTLIELGEEDGNSTSQVFCKLLHLHHTTMLNPLFLCRVA